jgi:signal transduction histidine kinase
MDGSFVWPSQVQLRTQELSVKNLNLCEEIAERIRAQRKAEEAMQAKSEFLSTISHEV